MLLYMVMSSHANVPTPHTSVKLKWHPTEWNVLERVFYTIRNNSDRMRTEDSKCLAALETHKQIAVILLFTVNKTKKKLSMFL